MAETVRVIGLREANAALKRLPDFAKAAAQKVMDVSAFQVARGAQTRVRRRTGHLAGAITWQSRPRSVSSVVGVARTAYYWKFLEYGTVKMAARPFMRPAAAGVERDHQQRLEVALRGAGDQVERLAQTRLI